MGLELSSCRCVSMVSSIQRHVHLEVFKVQVFEVMRGGRVAAVIDENVGAHVGIGHYNTAQFCHKAKNMFLVDSLLLWHMVTGAVNRGDVFVVNSRVHVTVFTEFPIGVNGNGELARALKVGLSLNTAGILRVCTTYPVEAGAGMKNI